MNIKYRELLNKKVPDGFKSYSEMCCPEDWEETLLSNVFDEVSILTSDVDNYPLYSLLIGEGVVPKTDRYERQFLVKKQEDNYKVVSKKTFVYNPMNVRFGAVALHKGSSNVSVSGYYNTFKSKNGYNPYFLEKLLISHRLLSIYNKYATGSLKEKQRLHYSQLLELEIPLPNYEEQGMIVEGINIFEELIKKNEEILELLHKRKKGLMEKLLSGEYRISGYTGEWMEVKLGDVVLERKETDAINWQLLSITSKDGVIPRSNIVGKDNSSKDKSKYKRIYPHDIGYNTMRMWQGVSGVSEFKGIVSPAYTILTPKAGYDSYFLGYFFKLPSTINLFHRYSQGIVSDTLNLKYENLKDITVRLPVNIDEQVAIASLLKSVDNEIALMIENINMQKKRKQGIEQLLLTGAVRVPSC